jgi:hypothetical protein
VTIPFDPPVEAPVWERRSGHGLNVTFPARPYTVQGERRSFSLLRPVNDVRAEDAIRRLILEAYDQYAAQELNDGLRLPTYGPCCAPSARSQPTESPRSRV